MRTKEIVKRAFYLRSIGKSNDTIAIFVANTIAKDVTEKAAFMLKEHPGILKTLAKKLVQDCFRTGEARYQNIRSTLKLMKLPEGLFREIISKSELKVLSPWYTPDAEVEETGEDMVQGEVMPIPAESMDPDMQEVDEAMLTAEEAAHENN